MKEVVAKDVWTILHTDPESVLVDVRTPREWSEVGLPVLKETNHSLACITWQPGEEAGFLEELADRVPRKETKLFFLCRSGVRSYHAGMLALGAGYENVTNIVDGFEDKHGPGTGWRASGLPWDYRPLSGS